MNQSLTTRPTQQVSKYNETDIQQELTILKSAFPKLRASDSDLRALVIAAKWSGLNPFRGEIYFVPGIGITVAAKIRANDAISYQASIGNTLSISFDRLTSEMCIEGTSFAQYADSVKTGDVAFLCRIISSRQRHDYFEMRMYLINELKALGYSGRELEVEVNKRAGGAPETRALGIVKAAEDFGETGKKFVAFGKEDRAQKRALTKALAIGGYAAPDMRSYGGVALKGETTDGEYTVVGSPEPITPGVTINGAASNIIDHDDENASPSTPINRAPQPPTDADPADLLVKLRPIYSQMATQMRAIGQEPCKPPANPTPAQVQACIDEMTKKIAEFNAAVDTAAQPQPQQ